MSSDETPNVPAARNTREAVREKAQQVNAKQSRARIVRRVIIGLVAVVAVGAVGTAVAMAVGSSVSEPTLNPGGLDDDGVVVHEITGATVSSAEIPATPSVEPTEAGEEATPTPEPTAAGAVDIHIYVDYLSPGAGEFERANALQLSGWITEGAATVTYHPVSLLTANSNGTKYSLRAAAAAACVAEYSPTQFYAFNHELLVGQPEVDSDGRSDVELADLAGAVGVDAGKKVRACIEDQDFVSWAKAATARALEGPLPGSEDLALSAAPMVVVNGQAYVGSLNDPAEFSQFVLTVSSDAYYEAAETATPTPTPTTEAPAATETPTETPAE
ncbi:DsbA family protein [Microbacterium sp. GXF0217]